MATTFYPAGCGSLPGFWLRELSLGNFPWTAILPLAIPQPLATAAWLHGGLLAGAMAATGWRLGLSEQYCQLARARYSDALWLLRVLMTTVWFGALGPQVWMVAGQPDGAIAFATLTFLLHLCCTFVLPLYLLYRLQWRLRLQYARQQGPGWAAELAGLEARRRPWLPHQTAPGNQVL